MKFIARLLVAVAILAPAATLRSQEPPPTVIESAGPSEMVSSDTETTFTFHDKVTVTGNNIRISCDLLVVIAKRSGDVSATLGKQDNFKSLVATGHVRIVQGDRIATCGRAEVFPGDDKVVLSESPSIRSTDDQYAASGPRMILYRGQRRAVIEGQAGAGTRILLPAIKDLGYDKNKNPAPAEPPPKPTPPK